MVLGRTELREQPVVRRASTLRNQLIIGFQLALVWSTILRSWMHAKDAAP